MTVPIEIKHFPVFEKGTFQKHPALFDRFFDHATDYLMEKFQKARKILAECEDVVTWPLITGPGFSAGTHPGSDNILIETMYAAHRSVYDSDCMYINPRERIFAISDPPGITTSSRELFKKLDRYLLNGSSDGLEALINRINKDTGYDDHATLSLVYIPQDTLKSSQPRAVVYVAGDTYLFHGNLSRGTFNRIDGDPQFIGTTHVHFEPQHIRLEPDDFIIIASDGISPLLAENRGKRLGQSLLKCLEEGPERFVTALVQSSNDYYEQHVFDKTIPRFGGNDNVSVLVVYPDDLIDTDSRQSFILGGYIKG